MSKWTFTVMVVCTMCSMAVTEADDDVGSMVNETEMPVLQETGAPSTAAPETGAPATDAPDTRTPPTTTAPRTAAPPTSQPPTPPTTNAPTPAPAPCMASAGGRTCTRGAELSNRGICECTEDGYGCQESSGLCKKIKTKDSDPPSPIAVFGFILLLGIVGFIFTNMAFYMWKKRLPFWVKNALCGCECSCEEKKKSDKKKKDSNKNPIDSLGVGTSRKLQGMKAAAMV